MPIRPATSTWVIPSRRRRAAGSTSSDGAAPSARARQRSIHDRCLFDLQRPPADEVPDPRFHTVETSQDPHRPLHSRRDPTFGGLEIGQNIVEAIAQVPDDVVVVERYPVSGVVNGRGTTDQNGVGHQLLQPGRGNEHILHSPGFHGDK